MADHYRSTPPLRQNRLPIADAVLLQTQHCFSLQSSLRDSSTASTPRCTSSSKCRNAATLLHAPLRHLYNTGWTLPWAAHAPQRLMLRNSSL